MESDREEIGTGSVRRLAAFFADRNSSKCPAVLVFPYDACHTEALRLASRFAVTISVDEAAEELTPVVWLCPDGEHAWPSGRRHPAFLVSTHDNVLRHLERPDLGAGWLWEMDGTLPEPEDAVLAAVDLARHLGLTHLHLDGLNVFPSSGGPWSFERCARMRRLIDDLPRRHHGELHIASYSRGFTGRGLNYVDPVKFWRSVATS